MGKQINITVDGVQITVPEGTTVLEAIKKLNKVVPTFCYHPKLPVFGGCRMCLVYESRWRRNIIACATKVEEGMEIQTDHKTTAEERKFILEMLFTRHPLDCPICDKAGECDLQNWGTYYGTQVNITPITPFEKIRPEENWESDFFEYVSNRCVLCLRCVSVCHNVVQAKTLNQKERGFEIVISPDKKPMDSKSSCEACGLCVDVCPVGAILFKPFKYKTRPWLLKESVVSCGLCFMQCPVAIDHDGKSIYRIRSTADLRICGNVYLGYDVQDSNRLQQGLADGKPISPTEGIKTIAEKINSHRPEETAVILSPYSSTETFKGIKKLLTKIPLIATSTITLDYMPTVAGFKEEAGEYTPPTEEEVLTADSIIVVGGDVSQTNPVMPYLFGGVYHEGIELIKGKKVYFLGESLKHLKKLNPVWERFAIKGLRKKLKEIIKETKGKTVVIYDVHSHITEKAYKIGKALGKFHKETGVKVLLAPSQTNTVGLYETVDNLTCLTDVLNKVKEGKIKNLIIFDEDITRYIEPDHLREVLMSAQFTAVISPFSDGLALSSNVAVGCSLWFEEERTTKGFLGERKNPPTIPRGLPQAKIVETILSAVKPQEGNRSQPKLCLHTDKGISTRETSIWNLNHITERSNNLREYRQKREGV